MQNPLWKRISEKWPIFDKEKIAKNQKNENQKCFIDFMEDADEKIEKGLIFEKEKVNIIF